MKSYTDGVIPYAFALGILINDACQEDMEKKKRQMNVEKRKMDGETGYKIVTMFCFTRRCQ